MSTIAISLVKRFFERILQKIDLKKAGVFHLIASWKKEEINFILRENLIQLFLYLILDLLHDGSSKYKIKHTAISGLLES